MVIHGKTKKGRAEGMRGCNIGERDSRETRVLISRQKSVFIGVFLYIPWPRSDSRVFDLAHYQCGNCNPR